MNRRLFILYLITIAVITTAPSYALTPEKPRLGVKVKDAVCGEVSEKIQTRITKYYERKDWHLKEYRNLKERLAKFVTRFKKLGLNTTKLESDLKELDTKIKVLEKNIDTYVSKLEATKAFTCGKSEGEFKAAVKEAQAAVQQVHKDAQEIRSYFRSTIKPDLMALRDQAVTVRDSDTD